MSNDVAQINHTGLWYDPKKPGYGITVHEQGSSVVSVVYFYGQFGYPQWAIGDRNYDFQLYEYTGSCPYCTSVQPKVLKKIGKIAINFNSTQEGLLSMSFAPFNEFYFTDLNFLDLWVLDNIRIVNLTP
jgi:hypothetical protein